MRKKIKQVVILFACRDSLYKKIPYLDVWDIDRDARNYNGSAPIVGHPPCRSWGKYRYMAKPRKDEKYLAVWCVNEIRRVGGVLEHPAGSTLWPLYRLPEPGMQDKWGGYTIIVNQSDWGHKCIKPTRLYIVGCPIDHLPDRPINPGKPTHVMDNPKNYKNNLPQIPKTDRERTPLPFALWLIAIARRSNPPILR